MRKTPLALAIGLIGIMLFAASGINEVHAQSPTIVYVDNAANRTTINLVSPIILPAFTGTVPRFITLYIRIARAPHVTNEPSLPSDKTYGWQVRLSWDPAYFKIVTPTSTGDILERNFLKRSVYGFNDPDNSYYDGMGLTLDEYWSLNSNYPTTNLGIGYDEAAGTVTVADGLQGFNSDVSALPPEYFDNADESTPGFYAPDKGRHLGDFYDLPYAWNLTQAVPQPDGTSVTDPNFNTLCSIRLQQTALLPAGSAGYRAFHLSDVLLFNNDGQTTYAYQSWDAYIGGIPSAPEFPLGLAFVMLLAPAVCVMYLWRRRVTKK